jgi:3',5'-cyclic AMP phosphodiesterase CpdA
MPSQVSPASLLAVSDLHVGFPENREIVGSLAPRSAADWLLVAGDVGEFAADIEWALGLLADRFSVVVWVPGNHELWTHPRDPVQLRGEQRYQFLVQMCRNLGVLTPEDPFPVWDGAAGPARIAPLFLLYDYTFLPEGAESKAAAQEMARRSGVFSHDEVRLHPDPHPSREAWCAARLALTEQRLAAMDHDMPTILLNHFPLTREPTRVLRYPAVAQWCGTTATADWHLRFNAAAVVYGHLHIPRTTWQDGVRFEEVSYGYPREWRRRAGAPAPPPPAV